MPRIRLSNLALALSLGLTPFAFTATPAFAQCATSGAITVDCNLTSATTGAITIGDTTNGTTVTVVSSTATLDHTIDDDDATADGIIGVNSSTVTVTQTAAIGSTNALSAILLNSGNWTTTADLNVGNITMGSTNQLTVQGTANINANITGSSFSNTINLEGTGNFGQAGNVVDLGAGNDRITISGATTINMDSIDAGDGTDTLEINGADVIVNSALSNLENLDVTTANTLTLTNTASNATVDLGTDGAAVIFNATGQVLDIDVTASSGSGDGQTVTLTDGDLSGQMNLNDGDDTVTLNGGTYTGNIDTGADDDTINLGISFTGNVIASTGNDIVNITGASITSNGTMSGVETLDLGGNTLTLAHAITGLNNTDNTGVDVNSGILNINNGGSVDGAIHSTGGSGTGTLEFGADSAGGTFALNGIVEDVDLTVTSGTLDTNGNALGANSALGNVTIASGATLNLNDNITSSSTLRNSGTLNIGSSAAITAQATSVGTLGFAGNYVYTIDNNGNNGTITATADDIDFRTSTVSLNVSDAAPLSEGQELLIAQGTAQVNNGTGQAATTITDTSFFYDFIMADGSQSEITTGGANNTELYVKTIVANDIDEISETANNAAAAHAARDLRQSSVSGLNTLLNSMNTVQSVTQFNNVAESIQPSVDAGHFVGAITSTLKAFDITRTRLAALRSGATTGVSSGSLYDNQSHLWVKGFGEYAKQDMREGIDGYSAHTYGATVGIDNDITSKATIGASFTYANTVVDSDNINAVETTIHNYQVMGYGDYDITNNAYISGIAGASFGKNNVERHNIGQVQGFDATGEFSSYQLNAQAEAGYDFHFNNGLQVTPSVLANYLYYNAENYEEDGVGGAGLIVSSDAMQALEVGFSLDTSIMLREVGTPEVFKPTLHLGYRKDLIGDKLETVSRFSGGGNSFKTQGFDPATETYEIGGSLEYFSPKLFSMAIEYGMDMKEDYLAHKASVQAKYSL